MMTIESTAAKIGRSMKKWENLMPAPVRLPASVWRPAMRPRYRRAATRPSPGLEPLDARVMSFSPA